MQKFTPKTDPFKGVKPNTLQRRPNAPKPSAKPAKGLFRRPQGK